MPFGEYKDFADCVSKNRDKGNPEAYCASVHKKITGKWPTEKESKLNEEITFEPSEDQDIGQPPHDYNAKKVR